jgi:hypothetical protein
MKRSFVWLTSSGMVVGSCPSTCHAAGSRPVAATVQPRDFHAQLAPALSPSQCRVKHWLAVAGLSQTEQRACVNTAAAAAVPPASSPASAPHAPNTPPSSQQPQPSIKLPLSQQPVKPKGSDPTPTKSAGATARPHAKPARSGPWAAKCISIKTPTRTQADREPQLLRAGLYYQRAAQAGGPLVGARRRGRLLLSARRPQSATRGPLLVKRPRRRGRLLLSARRP